MKKIFFLLTIYTALTFSANAQFGGKLKDLGKKVKDAASKPAETAPTQNGTPQINQPVTQRVPTANIPTASVASKRDEVRVNEYFSVTLGGKDVTQGGECLTKFGDVSGSSTELKFDEISCVPKGSNYFYMSLIAIGASGKGTFYIPRKDSPNAGKLTIRPYGVNTEPYTTDPTQQATVAITITAVTSEYVEGTLSGNVIAANAKTKTPITAKFKVEINKSQRQNQTAESQAANAKKSSQRSGSPNAKGEYFAVESGDSAIPFDASCASYSSYIEGKALVVRIGEGGCPFISNRANQSFDMIIQNYKGKGVYKVSSARALRTGEFSLMLGRTSDVSEQYTTEVDLGGLSTVTITNATAEYVEGTFKADLVNPLSRKKQSFAGSFRFNIGER